jgi:hypothetical protein
LRVALLVILLEAFVESTFARILSIAPSILSRNRSLWHKSLGCRVVSCGLFKGSSRRNSSGLNCSWLGGGGSRGLSLGSVFSKNLVNELNSI